MPTATATATAAMPASATTVTDYKSLVEILASGLARTAAFTWFPLYVNLRVVGLLRKSLMTNVPCKSAPRNPLAPGNIVGAEGADANGRLRGNGRGRQRCKMWKLLAS